jgi:hypothetical protein
VLEEGEDDLDGAGGGIGEGGRRFSMTAFAREQRASEMDCGERGEVEEKEEISSRMSSSN